METELLFEMSADLEPPIVLSGTPEGDRIIFPVKDGKFEGPRIKGRILPGGGDWFLSRPDGVGVLDVRIVLKADDGDLIYMTYRGLTRLPKAGSAPGAPLTIRTAPMFMVSTSSKYAWLNGVQAVGEGETSAAGVRYRIYEVK